MFSCEFCEISKNTFLTEHLRTTGTDDKTEKENLFHRFFIEMLLEHVTVNETGAFSILPDKENRVQYFVYNLPFYKQPIYKQTVLAC